MRIEEISHYGTQNRVRHSFPHLSKINSYSKAGFNVRKDKEEKRLALIPGYPEKRIFSTASKCLDTLLGKVFSSEKPNTSLKITSTYCCIPKSELSAMLDKAANYGWSTEAFEAHLKENEESSLELKDEIKLIQALDVEPAKITKKSEFKFFYKTEDGFSAFLFCPPNNRIDIYLLDNNPGRIEYELMKIDSEYPKAFECTIEHLIKKLV
jgi:hypothetical protein